MSLRISRGELKGRVVALPRQEKRLHKRGSSVGGARSSLGQEIRPTSSLSRCVLFNVLAHNPEIGIKGFNGLNVIDLCCGSGIVGIEFLSLGAEKVTFIDKGYSALEALAVTLKGLGIEGRSVISMLKLPQDISTDGVDIIFFDPPYNEEEMVRQQLENLVKWKPETGSTKTSSKKTLIILEMDNSVPDAENEKLEKIITRSVTRKTKMVFYRMK